MNEGKNEKKMKKRGGRRGYFFPKHLLIEEVLAAIYSAERGKKKVFSGSKKEVNLL
jgi:hypothetical protein